MELKLLSNMARQYKNNVHEPYQDLGRGLGSRKTGLSPPSNVITNRSKAVLLVRLISNENQLSFYSIYIP